MARDWYNAHAEGYDALIAGRKWMRIHHQVTWERTIQPYIPKDRDARILDAGGGTGRWTIPLARLGYRVVLADISERMLGVAKQKLDREGLLPRVEVVATDLANMGEFRDKSFDFTLCEGGPISFCSNPPRAIRELVRVTREGAFIVASVDNLYRRVLRMVRTGRIDQARRLQEGRWLTLAYPRYQFTPSELVERFREAGCQIIKLMGKNILPQMVDRSLLDDLRVYDAILRLELQCCEEPHMAGMGGQIAIVAKKAGVP